MSRDAAYPAHPVEIASAILLGTLLGLGLLAWMIASLAGLLAGGTWSPGGLPEVARVLARLPHHLDHLRAAWPRAQRSEVPGTPYFIAAAALVACASAGVGLVAARIRAASRRQPGFATGRQLAALHVRSTEEPRVVLGRRGRRLLAAEPRQSVLVVAPTQSGKTTGLAVPAILEWPGPVVALSVKTDLLAHTLSARQAIGEVKVFDPAGVTGLAATASWSPLTGCEDWGRARQIASWLAESATPRGASADATFWKAAAAKLLAPLLFAAASSGGSMADVVRWIDTSEETEVNEAIAKTKNRAAGDAMQANWSREERQQSSIYATAETIIEAYADPRILEASKRPDLEVAAIASGGIRTLYICGTVRDQTRLRPLFVTLMQQLIEAAYARASRRGAPLDPPLLLVLDEVANIAPIPDLDSIAATAAGHGVVLVTVLQDLAQAYDRWGRERADTIVNNHPAKLFGAGIADERTLEWLARVLGETQVQSRSRTTGEGRTSVTASEALRPALRPSELRQGAARSALLVHGNLPITWVKLRGGNAGPTGAA